jgi:hypothetical protein
MRSRMYVRFTCRWSSWFPIDFVSSPVVIHARGVNRLADRHVTPRHATSRLSQAEPAPALGQVDTFVQTQTGKLNMT